MLGGVRKVGNCQVLYIWIVCCVQDAAGTKPAAKKDDFLDDTDDEEPVDDSDADATWELKDTDEDD